jgi:hypothetical protein
MDSHSALLRRKVELALPALAAAQRRLEAHPRSAAMWVGYLRMLHATMRASVPLIEMAGLRAVEMAERDPVAHSLVGYLRRHADDERGHDRWLADDLAAVGVQQEELDGRPAPPAVAELIGAQYYWVLHYHPVAVLGYLLVAEGYPPDRLRIEEIRTRSGLPAEAFRTLLEHAELDPGHSAELDGLLDRLPLSEGQQEVLGLSALSAVAGSARLLDELWDRLPAPT